MKLKLHPPAFIVFVIFSLVLSACGVSGPAASASTAEPIKLKIAILPYLSNTVFQIAVDEGYFAKQNLDVELVPVQSLNELIPLLASGELDAGSPSPNAAFFNAVERDGSIKVILPLTDFVVKDCPTIAYLARTVDIKAGTYADKKSWPNARLVISTQSLTSVPGYVLGKTLVSAGVSVDDMKTQVVDLPAQEEALRSGQVDIVYAVEPAITRMTAKGDIGVLDAAEQYAPGLTSSMVVVGKKILDNPDVGKRFAMAYLQAVRQYLQGATPRNIQIASKLTKLPAELVGTMCWSSASADGKINLQSLMDYQSWLVERGLLDKAVEADKFYEPSFVAEALKTLGEYKP